MSLYRPILRVTQIDFFEFSFRLCLKEREIKMFEITINVEMGRRIGILEGMATFDILGWQHLTFSYFRFCS